ncbi:MAG: hypothetical protein IIY61_00230 [Ruminococcus sp.]|nr:hypothetical protein [Ruminococcus sp.]
MTIEEVMKIAQKGLIRPIDEQGKKDARVAAEIITIIQRENYDYTDASSLLERVKWIVCETL